MIVSGEMLSGVSWLVLGPWVVGAVFLWGGAIKAIAPHVFAAHLTRLGWIPRRLVQRAVLAAAAFEGALGVALILRVAPAVVLPATVVLLVALTAVSWWGVKSGQTTDCGCYGGYVVPSMSQSIALNAALAALALSAWIFLPPSPETLPWKFVAAAAVAVGLGAFAFASQQTLRRHGRFMIDMSPLKVGRRWRSAWGAVPEDETEFLVSFLGPDCPYCKQWVRVLNAIQPTPGLPRVAGVVATSRERLETFVEAAGIRFPITTIPQTLMNRLVWSVPTTVLVTGGRIQKQWRGNMPPEFFHRFRQAFFPEAETPLEPINRFEQAPARLST
ncbi:MAG TPA: MauE/DoxX family redox-associated membrane protein [Gemmatimonadaceae bacterium]|nr:MauE/DoxX family redox-associated membrane protein [Gemmatimonadaceae bacterium]